MPPPLPLYGPSCPQQGRDEKLAGNYLSRAQTNKAALIIRIGFWGPLYYNYNEEPPKNSIGNHSGPILQGLGLRDKKPTYIGLVGSLAFKP